MQCKSPNSDTSGRGQFALIRMQLKIFRLVKFLMQNILGTRMRTKTAVHTAKEMKFMNFFTLFFLSSTCTSRIYVKLQLHRMSKSDLALFLQVYMYHISSPDVSLLNPCNVNRLRLDCIVVRRQYCPPDYKP